MRYVARAEPGTFPAGMLAVLVHLALFAFLFLTVRWQMRPPVPVSAELWSQVPVLEVPRQPTPKPVVEPKPEPPPPPPPPPEVKAPPPPPPPEVKAPPPPPPPVERPAVQKPDIALEQEKKAKEEKARQERERQEREKKERLEKEKLEKEKLAREKLEKDRLAKLEREKQEKQRIEQELKRETERTRERLAKEIDRESAERETERKMRELAAAKQASAAANNKARAAWIDRIRAKIRGNIIIPDITGNPSVQYRIVILPSGEITEVTLVRSDGTRVWDEAVERAIRKSSPLPLPENSEVFERVLSPTFRPKE